MTGKDVWISAMMVIGEVFVMIVGVHLMQQLYADSLDSLPQV